MERRYVGAFCFWAIVSIIIIVLTWRFYQANKSCNERGGAYVKSSGSYTCVGARQ